jgi:hypothetical protein
MACLASLCARRFDGQLAFAEAGRAAPGVGEAGR